MKTILQLTLSILLFCFSVQIQAQTVPTPDHVVVVIMENHGYSQIIGQSAAPYINSLATDTEGALFTNSNAITHPSQPNYLCLFSGSSQGVLGDLTPASFQLPFTTANLGAELLAAGKTFVGYSEDLPSVGFTGDTYNNYARKHAPWVNWQGGTTNGIPASLNQPYTSFPAHYDSLPTISFVIPNLQDDMHDGTIQQGDTWLQNNINNYVIWAKTHNSLLILTWDEDENTLTSTAITTIFVGQMVKAGQYSENINHYSVLRTMEAMYSLPYAGSSSTATTITDCWVFKPHSAMHATPNSICVGQSVSLADSSTNLPTVWQWYFTGGTPALSYAQTPPVVTYNAPGTYNVKLITGNHMGFDTVLMSGYITVNANPSLSLNTDSVTICHGDTATVIASGATTYNWLPAGGIVSSVGNTLKAAPSSNATYLVTGSSNGCPGDTVTASVMVNSSVSPAVNLIPGADTTVCSGTSINFSAVATNGGNSPGYQWQVNGSNVGTGTSTFSALALNNNFTVKCIVSSNAQCASPASVASSIIHVTVTQAVTPSVNISATSGNTICAGTSVDLNAVPVNGGSTPVYQWLVNGNDVGNNSASFSTAVLNNNDVVSCILTSDVSCATNPVDTSNAIMFTVNQPVANTINAGICSGSSYSFKGMSLTTAGTYMDTLISSAGCDSMVTLNLTVNQTLSSSINTGICSGDSYNFNGQSIANAGTYVDTMTAVGGCDSVVTLNLTVNSLPTVSWGGSADTVLANGNVVPLAGGYPAGGSYSGTGVTGNNFYPDSVGPGSYVITYNYMDNNGCSGSSNKTFVVVVTGINEASPDPLIAIYPNPANDHLIVKLNLLDFNVAPCVCDMTGRIVISSYTKQSGGITFNTASLSPGVYWVRFNVGGKEISRRFVKGE